MKHLYKFKFAANEIYITNLKPNQYIRFVINNILIYQRYINDVSRKIEMKIIVIIVNIFENQFAYAA